MNLLRWPEVLKKVPYSRAHLHRMIRRGDFPAPLQLSEHRVAFDEDKIEEWISSRPVSGGGPLPVYRRPEPEYPPPLIPSAKESIMAQTDTTMSDAMHRAGIRPPPAQRLHEIVSGAIDKHGADNLDVIQKAIIESDDVAAALCLFEEHAMAIALRAYVAKVRPGKSRQRDGGGHDGRTGDGQFHTTPATPSRSEAGHENRAAGQPTSTRHAPGHSRRSGPEFAARRAKAMTVLDVTIVNGQPLRAVTFGEGRMWAWKHREKAAIVLTICANQPRDAIVGDVITDERAEELAAAARAVVRSQEQYDAA